MFTLPTHLAEKLPPQVTHYIPTFIPQRLLTEQQWARCREAVWASCAATLPTSREDAKTQMSVTCAFLAFTDRVAGSLDLSAVLTHDLIDRFAINSEGEVSHETRRNRGIRLRRALKAATGAAPRTVHGPRRLGPLPYATDELNALAAAAIDSAPLAAALALGLTAGGLLPAAIGMAMPAGEAVRTVAAALEVNADWSTRITGDAFETDQWAAARAAAAAVGVSLIGARLRATWLHALLSAAHPLAQTARDYSLTRADLDNAAGHLAPVTADQVRAALRS